MQIASLIRQFKNRYHFLKAFLANLYFGFPSKKLKVIGVTGTDGKTTTVYLIYEILKSSGKKVSMISSVYAVIAEKKYETGFHITTSGPWQLQKLIRQAVEKKEKYLVLEVTSHGLDQNRVWGIPFEIGVLTNVTLEHLDYHKTYDEYLKAKMKLLDWAKIIIVNREDRSFSKISNSKFKTKRLITYGLEKGDLTSHNFKFSTPLPGEYNRLNCLAAICAGRVLGVEDENIRQTLAQFKGVPGRFEFIKSGKDFNVLIDFAHTPNALAQVLKTVRPMIKEQLIHVFGSAGLRDYKKRPLMGEISAKYADVIILTEEDYRTEDVGKIMDQIKTGILKNIKNQKSCQRRGSPKKANIKNTYKKLKIYKIQNRQKAINKAVSIAKKGDLILLTGKGHEKSLCRGKKEYLWSEHEAVRKALKN